MTEQIERRRSTLPPSLPPRGLCRVTAAEYIGVSASKFDQLVRDRRMPGPKRIDGCRVWDRLSLDRYFAALSEEGEERHSLADEIV